MATFYAGNVQQRIVTPFIASVALILAFVVAQATGQRWLGGVLLVVAAVWCGLQWKASSGAWRALAAVAVYGVAFAVSHPLSGLIGAWPSVIAVSAASFLVALLVTGRRRRV